MSARLCKGCGDRSKPLNPAALSDYHPACHPAKNKTGPKPPGDFFSKIREEDQARRDKLEIDGMIKGGKITYDKVDIAKQEIITPTGHRGPKPMNTSVRDLLKGSAGMLEKRAKLLEKRAARIGAKVDRVWKKVEPLKKIQEDLLEAARKLRLILSADD